MQLFSIAIPVYRQQQFIATALKSIQAQSVAYELAVMDATPDNSVQIILDQYADIISYRRHRKDDGQSEAIQEGWDNTSGDIVAWLCADDYYFPDTLQLVQEVFEQHPEVDVVYGDSVYVDADDRFKMYFPAIERDVSCLPAHDCIAQPSCFIRRAALESVGGLNTDLHYIMDWDLWTRLYKDGAKFHYLNQCLSVTRIYADTKTSSMSLCRYREINNQLKMQSSLLRRVRSLVGMLYYDLRENKRTAAMNSMFFLLNLYLSAKRKLSSGNPKRLYGLEIWSNNITENCNISLPWYRSESPHSVTLTISPNVEVTLSVDGEFLTRTHSEIDDEQLFIIPDKLLKGNIVVWHFELQVEQPCHLSSFVLA